MTLTPGTRIGSYEAIAQIGVGGMGEVHRDELNHEGHEGSQLRG
jgi:hypothetical protein